jgi:glycine cleavage system H protein
MSKIDKSARYLKSHEWIRAANDNSEEYLCGISDHAQDALSDLVYVELPRVGTKLSAGATFGVVESVKAASDVYAPVSCTVVDVNGALETEPGKINVDPYGEGWLMRVKIDNANDLNALMDATAYESHLSAEEH